jgi:hypothetical protein
VSRGRFGRGVAGATLTLSGAVASFCALYALCIACRADTRPAILAAILAIGLGRRERVQNVGQAALACLRIAGIAVAASAIGSLLLVKPLAGAGVFVGAIFLSVYVRKFGERARSLGALVALPLVAMLIVPAPALAAPGGRLVDLALVLAAGVVALAFVTALQWLGPRVGPARDAAGPRASAGRAPAARAAPAAPGPRRLSPSTRMALQMAVALAAAFASGFAIFPGHWGWCVLTAFIVSSGARGRGDALYKAALRLLGALGGTLAAATLVHLWAPRGVAEAVTIFGILFAGLALRDLSYAYWAACTTLILALLASGHSGFDLALLGTRLEAILAGALCAVAATWFVVPIRTEAVVRRRLADLLVAFDDVISHAASGEHERADKRAQFEHHMAELASVAPPVRWHRRFFARKDDANHPARWIDLATGLREHVDATPAPASLSAARTTKIRRAIGISRRAIASHGNPELTQERPRIGDALVQLHAELERFGER